MLCMHRYRVKEIKQITTRIRIDGSLVFVLLLVDRTLNTTFEVLGMNGVIDNFKQINVLFLDEVFDEERDHGILAVNMLLGTDVLEFMSSTTFEKIPGVHV